MKFLELAKARYSCRNYKQVAVPPEKLDYILECARVAPSAANFQPWHIIVIQDPQKKAEIAAVYPRDWFRDAPALLILCGDHQASWKRQDGKDHCDIDISIITDHITLAAAEQELATCWICNFNAALCSEILRLPDEIEPIVILTLGFPNDTASARHENRKTMNEIIHRERF